MHLSPLLDGTWKLDGLLDAELGTRLSKLLQQRVWEATRAGDTRTARQVRADALMELVECGHAHREHGPGRNAATDLSIHVSLAEIERRAGPELAVTLREQAPHGLTTATLRRLACDARIARVITDGRSQPLDVGRSSRTPTHAQWVALVARDRGCRWPGCDRPPGWCRAHHIQHWIDLGPTDLDNLILLCGHHHRMAHEGGKDPPHAKARAPT